MISGADTTLISNCTHIDTSIRMDMDIYANVHPQATGRRPGKDSSYAVHYTSEQPKLHLKEDLHRNLSTTLNTTVSRSSLPKATDPPWVAPRARGIEGRVSTSRRGRLVPLVVGLGLLFTLPALIAVAYLYTSEQAKLHLIEDLHRNLSTTLNTTDLIAGVEELFVKNEHFLNLQKSFDASSGCRVCPEGWAHHSGKCFFFSSTKKIWMESRDHCTTLGGHLAIVNSQEEQTFLVQNAKGHFHWIGLSDQETEGQWIWVDSTPLKKTGAVFWLKRANGNDEPDDWKQEDPTGEDCACLSDSGQWHDNPCGKPHSFVCETLASK